MRDAGELRATIEACRRVVRRQREILASPESTTEELQAARLAIAANTIGIATLQWVLGEDPDADEAGALPDFWRQLLGDLGSSGRCP